MEELGYTGYQTLRRAFDKAFVDLDEVPTFDMVVDAGCGTGLVGEQVSLRVCRIFGIFFDAGTVLSLFLPFTHHLVITKTFMRAQFRNVSNHLVGVDLSPSIIEEAIKARPGLYDETKVGDITEVFVEKKPVSLIIAGDSYIYFGDLVPLFKSMEEGLGEGGIAAFTLENASDEATES